MSATARIRFAGKNTGYRPKTADSAFRAADSYCSALQPEFSGGLEVSLHPNRVIAGEVVA